MQDAISLYVHIPFCVKKCLFCSFAVAIGQSHRVEEYLSALKREAESYRGRRLKTIYLGGGTPSFLSDDQIQRLVDMIRSNFVVDDSTIWSIECNPEGMDDLKARCLKSLGFGRISLGVQTFDETNLKFLGRVHNQTQALRAFDVLRNAGFDNINVDLMYGFPKQTKVQLNLDLEIVCKLHSEHVSVYTLTIEPNSRFYAQQMKLDDDEKLADDYVYVTEFLEGAGLMQYEVSNFARPSYESQHNMVYWQGGDYIGLGMGAHSFLNNRRFWNKGRLMEYMQSVAISGQAVEGYEDLSDRTRLTERLIFGLRMNRGVYLPILEKEVGCLFEQRELNTIDFLIKEGFLIQTLNHHIATTLKGRLSLDEIATRLV